VPSGAYREWMRESSNRMNGGKAEEVAIISAWYIPTGRVCRVEYLQCRAYVFKSLDGAIEPMPATSADVG